MTKQTRTTARVKRNIIRRVSPTSETRESQRCSIGKIIFPIAPDSLRAIKELSIDTQASDLNHQMASFPLLPKIMYRNVIRYSAELNSKIVSHWNISVILVLRDITKLHLCVSTTVAERIVFRDRIPWPERGLSMLSRVMLHHCASTRCSQGRVLIFPELGSWIRVLIFLSSHLQEGL